MIDYSLNRVELNRSPYRIGTGTKVALLILCFLFALLCALACDYADGPEASVRRIYLEESA
jgi:hypothetical protein